MFTATTSSAAGRCVSTQLVVVGHNCQRVSTAQHCHCDNWSVSIAETTTTTTRRLCVYETSPDDTCSPDLGLLVCTDTQTKVRCRKHAQTRLKRNGSMNVVVQEKPKRQSGATQIHHGPLLLA